ncbi:MAG TPA: CocE/NonD family hydrolase [Planctomycetota bacterium]|nr:CocE/NonD family hydrolase [Planctomycetota bacterium]
MGLLLLLLVLQAPDPGAYSPEKHGVKVLRGQKVPTRDGIELTVDLYLPETDERVPAVLTQTPYDRGSSAWTSRAPFFVKRGYAYVLSDVRGRFDSGGDWDPFTPRHKTDGYDLVEWIARQPWCSGKVGTLGLSYMGWTQWWTATQAPPSLKVIVPEVAPPDHFYNMPYQHGVGVSWAVDWASMMAGRRFQPIGPGPRSGFFKHRDEDMRVVPLLSLNGRRGSPRTDWFETWIRDNLSTSPYWKGIAYQGPENWGRITVPSLNVTGWFDADYPGAPMNYLGMKAHGGSTAARRPALVIGPWSHIFNRSRTLLGVDFGREALIDWNGYVCRWFDRWLKGVENGVENDPPVHVFIMGRNRWSAEKDWPVPGAVATPFYFRGAGRANSSRGDGLLLREPPGDEPADAYVYDPENPTPSAISGDDIHGPDDVRGPAERDDVLVYQTPPLEAELEAVGPIQAKLFASTSAKDTDWMVRLVDVAPDGRASLLCDGVLRARCRDPLREGAFTPERLSLIEPDRVYEYTIEFWRGTANVFRKGHRVRVEVSSAYFPFYLRNLNSGADNVGLETRSVPARQKVFHTATYPSRVLLPLRQP